MFASFKERHSVCTFFGTNLKIKNTKIDSILSTRNRFIHLPCSSKLNKLTNADLDELKQKSQNKCDQIYHKIKENTKTLVFKSILKRFIIS